MAVRKKTPTRWVVLIDPTGADTGECVEVCCGRCYSSLGAAEKEAKRYCTEEGGGWVAVAQIVRIGKTESNICYRTI